MINQSIAQGSGVRSQESGQKRTKAAELVRSWHDRARLTYFNNLVCSGCSGKGPERWPDCWPDGWPDPLAGCWPDGSSLLALLIWLFSIKGSWSGSR